jgi:branched-chain amino acid transport system substrate-binding protein
LPAPPKDVAAMQEVLQHSEMGGFDEVKTLVNPNHSEMAVEIETWFESRQPDDLAVLFFSGHGVKDESRELYFAACDTRKINEKLIKATAVSANFVRSCLRRSKSKRQVVILDCCFSGAFGDLLAKDDGDVDLESQLGTEGEVVLTSSSSLQYSFEQEGSDLSIYTRYLVEGIKTGAADQDGDGHVSVGELHEYARKKVQVDASAMTPKIIVLKDEGYKIKLAKAPIGDPKLKYRKEAERLASESISQGMRLAYEGRFSSIAREILAHEWDRLGLSQDEAKEIEVQVLQPYIEHQDKLNKYRTALERVLQDEYPLSTYTSNNLKDYQKRLRLRDEDIEQISKPISSRKETVARKKRRIYLLLLLCGFILFLALRGLGGGMKDLDRILVPSTSRDQRGSGP